MCSWLAPARLLVAAAFLATLSAAVAFSPTSVYGTKASVYLLPSGAPPGSRAWAEAKGHPLFANDTLMEVWQWNHVADASMLKRSLGDSANATAVIYFQAYLADAAVWGTAPIDRLKTAVAAYTSQSIKTILFLGDPEFYGVGTWATTHDIVRNATARAYLLHCVETILAVPDIATQLSFISSYWLGASSRCTTCTEEQIGNLIADLQSTANAANVTYLQHVDGPFWDAAGGEVNGYSAKSLAIAQGVMAESWCQGSLKTAVSALLAAGGATTSTLLMLNDVPNCDDLSQPKRCSTGSLAGDTSAWFGVLDALNLGDTWGVWDLIDGGAGEANSYGDVQNNGTGLTPKGALHRARGLLPAPLPPPALWSAINATNTPQIPTPPTPCNPKLPTKLCPGGVECPNCGKASCLCPQPWKQCPPHCPGGHPVPPATQRPYSSIGSIDVGTYENTIFWWANTTYLLENIPCTYLDHAGKWFPAFVNHSYARIRELRTGKVVNNITSSIAFGFLNVFPDYNHNRLWLFGTPSERCKGNCGVRSDGVPACTSIQSWWTSLSEPTIFKTAVAIPAGTSALTHTYNQGVTRVRVPGPGMPPHRYAMISEPFTFLINNDPDGNLTAAGAGWKLAPSVPPTGAQGGGVTMQWVADPVNESDYGWYYSISGGNLVGFARSRQLMTWEPWRVAMSQAVGQYKRAPLNGFTVEAASRKGWAEMAEKANWPRWGYDNNDGDVCCGDEAAAAAAGHGTSPHGWVVWGASTQGLSCGLAHCSTNAVGRFNGSLGAMLESFF